MPDNSGLIIAALEATDPALALAIDARNSWQPDVKRRGARVAKYRRYERGDHDASMTNQMRAMLRLQVDDSRLNELCINYMPIIIDKMAGRLNVTEVKGENEAADTYIADTLKRNDFESTQGMTFRGAIRDGDSYMMADPRSAKWTCEPAYDGFSGIVTIYMQGDDWPVWACKLWSYADMDVTEGDEAAGTTTKMHIKVYQPARISSWTGQTGSQTVDPAGKVVDLGNGMGEVLDNIQPWPLGYVPIVHFADSIDNYTQYGESQIRKAMPAQDILNRTLYSMTMTNELTGFPVTWSIGMGLPNNSGVMPGSHLSFVLIGADGKPVTEPTEQQVEFMKTVKVGQFESADMSQFISELENLVKQISQVTQTPIYGVTAQGNLSGEALKQLEIGFIGKVKRFQRENSKAVTLLIQLTADIQAKFNTGLGEAPALGQISVNWASPEILDVSAAITSILDIRERAPGLFDDDFLRGRIGALLDLTQSQIEKEGAKAGDSAAALFGDLVGGGTGRTVPIV